MTNRDAPLVSPTIRLTGTKKSGNTERLTGYLFLFLMMVALLLAVGSIGQDNITPISQISPSLTIAMSDKDQAVQVAADTERIIQKSDGIIAWFRGNASTREDPHLPTIIAKREAAVSYLSTAKDEFSYGNYTQAREHADEAFKKANESYYDALQRQHDITHRPTCPSVPLSWDRILASFLIGIIPALLTGTLYSLLKMMPFKSVKRPSNFRGTFSAYGVFFGTWLVFSSIPILGVIAFIYSRNIAYFILIIWGCLMLAEIIFALIIIGSVTVRTVSSRIKNRYGACPTDDYEISTCQKTRNALILASLIFLTVLMPVVFLLGFKIFSLPLCID